MQLFKDSINTDYYNAPNLWLSFGFEFKFENATGTPQLSAAFDHERTLAFEVICLVLFLLLFLFYKS